MFRKVTIAWRLQHLECLHPTSHPHAGAAMAASAASTASTAVVSTEVAALVETVFTPAALVEAFATRRSAGAHSGPVGRALSGR
jgi:hypothetical protein